MESTKKRILYIVTKGNFGGAQRYVYDLALASHTAGYEVLVAAGTDGELFTRLAEQNIATKIIEGLTRNLGITSDLRALYSLSTLIRTYDPDIVHLNSSKTGVLGSILGRVLGVPKIIFTAHGWPVFEERPWHWKTLAYLGSYLTTLLAHHTIEVSHHDHTLVLPLTNHKRSVIPTALPPTHHYSREDARSQLFDDLTKELHRTNTWLVSIAELHPNKNLSLAIDAIAEYNTTHHTKIFYTILGGGELEHSLREQIALRGQADYITLLGHTNNAREYLLAFDIFVLPSKKEGLPYALLEAGQAALPCIATNVGGIPEVITDSKTGLLISPNDLTQLVRALDTLITRPDIRITIAENLTELIKGRHDLKDMTDATLALYR